MKLIHKLLGGFLIITLFIWVAGLLAYSYSKKALLNSYIENGEALALEIMNEIDKSLYMRIEVFRAYTHDELLRDTLEESNRVFSEMPNPVSYISLKDREWTSAPDNEETVFMEALLNNKLSAELKEKTEFYERQYGYDVYGEVFVTNRYGANVAQTGRTSDYKQDDEEWWQAAKRDGFYIQDIEFDESSKTYSTDIGLRVDDKAGRFIGIIKVVLNIEEIIRTMQQKMKRGVHSTHTTETIRLLTREGKIIYSNLEGEKFLMDGAYLLPGRQSHSAERHAAESHASHILKETDHGAQFIIYAYSAGYGNFKGLGWLLVMSHDVEELFAPADKLKKSILTSVFIVTILASLMGIVLSVYITGNVRKLRNAALRIGKGKLDTEIDVKSTDEIGELALAFKHMTNDLRTLIVTRQKLTGEIKESEEKYRTLFKSAGDAIMTLKITEEGPVFTDCNERTLEMFGCSYEDVINQSPLHFSPPFQPDGTPSAEKFQKLANKVMNNPSCSFEWRHIRSNEEPFDVEVNVNAVELGSGIQLLAAVRDITKRKQMQHDLERMNKELARSNSELQQFAYIASHDLQEPLRKIKIFSDRLKDKYNGFVGEQGRDYIERMQGAVERMSGLIDGLLKFSRVTTKAKPFEPVDLDQVTKEVISDLEVCIEQSGGTIETADLPIVNADSLQMRQLLQNLISNALKFHKENETPKVRVCGNAVNGGPDDFYTITVEDNGIGFDEKNAGRMFGMFQRLHGRSEYEGSGIGLAVCKKIVERHGGNITAESRPGAGAKFVVTLPDSKQAEAVRDTG